MARTWRPGIAARTTSAAAYTDSRWRGRNSASSRAGTTTCRRSIGPGSSAHSSLQRVRPAVDPRVHLDLDVPVAVGGAERAAARRPRRPACTCSGPSSTQPSTGCRQWQSTSTPSPVQARADLAHERVQRGRTEEVADLRDDDEVEAARPASPTGRRARRRARDPGPQTGRGPLPAQPRSGPPPGPGRTWWPAPPPARRSSSPAPARSRSSRAGASPAPGRACAARTNASRLPTGRARSGATGPGNHQGTRPTECAGSARVSPRSGRAAPGPATSRHPRAPRAAPPGWREPAPRPPSPRERAPPGGRDATTAREPARDLAQCQNHTGYSHRSAPVRRAAVAAARPAASWSGCPSRSPRGHDERLPAVAHELDQPRASTRSSWPSTSPSESSTRCTTSTPSAVAAARPSRDRICASSAGVRVGESGWLCSPSVAHTMTTSRPEATAVFVRPPAPRDSSSGCAASTTTRA